MRLRLHDNSHYVATLEDGQEVYLDRVSHILADVGIGPKFGRNGKAAAALGSDFHGMASTFFRTGALPVWPPFDMLTEEQKALYNCWVLFLDWWREQDLEPLDSERRVVSFRLAYAGTLDVRFRCRRTGRIIIVDFKTSKPLTSKPSKVSYKLQLGAYGLALAEMGEGLPDAACVVRVGKECEAFEVTTAWENWDDASEVLYAWEQTVMLASYIRGQREAA